MKNINLAMPEPLLARLIYEGHLCAADVKCLDTESKQRIWQLCLWACKERAGCQKPLQPQYLDSLLGKRPGNISFESDGPELTPGVAFDSSANALANHPCGSCEQRCLQWLEQTDVSEQADNSADE